ncbi:MAG: HEAT repeat domain-containing protein [Acidobacteria bacterium]|nr:HEAT repeat domain-containing protein [Acidobacteriota bacterium]
MPVRRSWPLLAAAAVVLAAVSAGGGWLMGRQSPAPQPRDEVAALRSEVAGLRSLVAVSMLGQGSAGARLQGISYATRPGTPESPEVLEALVSALQHDEHVNVRLAACDALRRQTANPAVRRVLARALATEDSPLVKVSLIEALADASARESVRPLLNLKSAANEDEAVRTEAARALDRLKSKGISRE